MSDKDEDELDLFDMSEWEDETLPMFPNFVPKKKKIEDKGPPPPDNIGRKYCWWCGRATTMKPLFNSFYEFCEPCRK